MKRIICRIIELVFPGETNRVKAERRAKRTAMQQMLDADHALRANGYGTNRINEKLRGAVRMYERGSYKHVPANIPWV